MSNGRYRQRSEPGRAQNLASWHDGYEYAQYQPGAAGREGRGHAYPQEFAPTQYDPAYAYQMYGEPGYDPRMPQNFGNEGYGQVSNHWTYGNNTMNLHQGNEFGDSVDWDYPGQYYSNWTETSHYPTQQPNRQPNRQSYSTYRDESYYNYGRHSQRTMSTSSNYSTTRSYSSYSSQQPSQSNFRPQDQESSRQRRASPAYDDYTPDTGSTSHPNPSQPSKYRRRSPSPRSNPLLFTPSFSLRNQARPLIKEKRTAPTDEYLAISSQPSHNLNEESIETIEKGRKMIVLDLNGTLVLRGQHRKAAPDYVSPTRGGPPSGTTFHVRSVHPRPYLSSFIEYILHNDTKKWLDAMVWSSAQPRSVDDMVGKSFGERRKELRVVWARDTLGLSNEDYHKKSVTLKDLEKPWAELPFILPTLDADSLPSSRTSSPAAGTPSISRTSSPAPVPPSSQITAATSPPPSPQNSEEKEDEKRNQKQNKFHHHSATSTLLIDDSPIKASLQPWNHLCIKEYVAEMRKVDLEVLEQEEGLKRADDADGQEGLVGDGGKKKKKERHRVKLRREAREKEATMLGLVNEDAVQATGEAQVESTTKTTPADDDEHITDTTTTPISTVVGDHTTETAPAATTATPNITHETDAQSSVTSPSQNKGAKEYDQTLLAVIGVLDRIRCESNVAGWLRAGGLMRIAGHDGDEVDMNAVVGGSKSPPTPTSNVPSTKESQFASAATEERRSTEIETDTEEGKGKRKTKLVHTRPTRSRDASPMLPSSDSKKRRRVGDVEVNIVVEAERILGIGMEVNMDTRADEAQEMTGVPLESSPSTPKPNHPSSGVVDAQPGGDGSKHKEKPEKPKLWFEHPEVFAYWVARGKKALDDLGIAAVPGVRR